ncbi:MAG: hypothetical protein KKD21_06500 [Proteobacteria bacterium]|nr:hypothetical protein [Pseudomonadota bacterium]MBU1696681.1 hypothetical protein [Pseudomonadota bacterium]
MKKIIILKTGDTAPAITRQLGEFDDRIMAAYARNLESWWNKFFFTGSGSSHNPDK